MVKYLNGKWPNFFIVGAPRSGTTALYNYLNEIPEIFMSPVKEPGYFIPNDFRGFSKETYLDLFQNVKNETVIGEASAGYLANEEVPHIIKKQIPHAKIIITLRDPIQRTFSHYLNRVRTGDIDMPIENAMKKILSGEGDEQFERLIKTSQYYEQVERYFEVFGRDKVLILIFEETVKDVKNTIKTILEFLEVKCELPDTIEEKHNSFSEPLGSLGTSIVENQTISKIAKKIIPNKNREKLLRTMLNKKGKKPELPIEVRNELYIIFHDNVKKLENLLGHSVPWSTANNEGFQKRR